MKGFTSLALAVAGLGLIGSLALPVRADDAGAVIEARQKLMKANGAEMKAISAWVKGESKESAADIAKRGAVVADDARQVPAAFKQNYSVANTEGIKTTAKPDIWNDWAKFEELAGKMEKAAEELAASGNDPAKAKAAANDLGKTCGACHQAFRVKTS